MLLCVEKKHMSGWNSCHADHVWMGEECEDNWVLIFRCTSWNFTWLELMQTFTLPLFPRFFPLGSDMFPLSHPSLKKFVATFFLTLMIYGAIHTHLPSTSGWGIQRLAARTALERIWLHKASVTNGISWRCFNGGPYLSGEEKKRETLLSVLS